MALSTTTRKKILVSLIFSGFAISAFADSKSIATKPIVYCTEASPEGLLAGFAAVFPTDEFASK